jgi:hypothetical protein
MKPKIIQKTSRAMRRRCVFKVRTEDDDAIVSDIELAVGVLVEVHVKDEDAIVGDVKLAIGFLILKNKNSKM